jgi:hypothetical protein
MAVDGVNGTNSAEEAQRAGQTGATDEANAKSAEPPISNWRGGDLNKLKHEHPELYEQIVMGMATEMTNKMRKNQENLKKLMREGQKH